MRRSLQAVVNAFTTFQKASHKVDLVVNEIKTEIMGRKKKPVQTTHLIISKYMFQNVNESTYWGSRTLAI
jgi:hypothetical protein